MLERLNLLVVHDHLSIVHVVKHSKLGLHHPLLMLLLEHVSLLVGISGPELVHHGELVVGELLGVGGPWLLALGGTETWSSWVGLLRLSLLLDELGVQETVCICRHELVREACGAMLHAELLVGLMLVLLGPLQLHVGRMLLLLLL